MRLNQVVDAERTMSLQQGTQSGVYLQPGPARGTIVMYHGFTAGSWQFELLARRAYADGFNVYAPRLPGHGLNDPRAWLRVAGAARRWSLRVI